MGSSGVGQEMFSFGFDTEILSFFWSGSDRDPLAVALPVPPPTVSPADLFRLLVTPPQAKSGFLTWLQYSVVTTGVVTVVGLGSYCTYRCLRNVRQSLFDSKCLRNPPAVDLTFPIEEPLAIEETPGSSLSQAMQLVPAHLKVSIWSQLNSGIGISLQQRNKLGVKGLRLSSSVQSLGRSLLSEDSESDEDGADLEGKYFGPASFGPDSEVDLTDDENDPEAAELLALEEPPASPTDSAYTSEYEALPRPADLRLHNINNP